MKANLNQQERPTMQEENNNVEDNSIDDSISGDHIQGNNNNSVDEPHQKPSDGASENQEENPVSSDPVNNGDDNDNGSEPELPEWFMKDKFSSMDEQAKAYHELQKKMGKNWGAPKDDYSLEGIEGINKDDPLLKNLAPALKELGLSQDGFGQLVKQYQAANVKMAEKFEQELKHELTVKDAQTYQTVTKWMQDVLTPEEITQVQNNWLMTPADFKLFNHLRLMAAPSSNVPSSMQSDAPRFESSHSVEQDKVKYRKEIKEGLRVPDKNHENELAQRYRDALTREMRAKG